MINVFYSEDGRKKLTVKEAAERFLNGTDRRDRPMSDRAEKKMIIASRLKEARKMAGLTQGQVASQMGLHRPAISEVEAGNRSVSGEELTAFASLYEVSVGWLAGEGPTSSTRTTTGSNSHSAT